MNRNWLYLIKYSSSNAAEGEDVLFNPASLNKIFYAIYLLDKHSLEHLLRTELRYTMSYWRAHRKGTRKLRFSQIGQKFPLLTLLEYALRDSCNIATAMLADYAGREKVNTYIKDTLQLKFTHLPGKGLGNESTLSDLAKTLALVTETELLTPKKKEFLLQTMQSRTTEAFIKPLLEQDFKIFSKGGTTFTGQKRDMAIIQNRKNGKYGYVIFSDERDLPLPDYNLFDKILARQKRGKLHKHLQFVESSFGNYVKKILNEFIR